MRLRIRAWAVLVASCAGWAMAQSGTEVQQVTGFRVPSYDRDGNLTSQMYGDTARIMPDGGVDISELRVEFYRSGATNRDVDMRVSSPRCYYNRGTGVATSDAPVRIARDNMVVTGTGFAWSSHDERMRIEKNAKVVIKDVKRAMKEGVSP